MSKTPQPPRGGAMGLIVLLCFAAAAIGLGFDFGLARPSFWAGDQPGGAAAIGAGAALFAVLAARAARFVFGARAQREEGGRDAGGHA